MLGGAWGVAVASFEPFRREGAHQVAEMMAGPLDEQQCGALRRVGEDRGVRDPLALDGAAEVAAVPDPRDQVLLPGRVRIDLDRGVPLAGQQAREVTGGVADVPPAARVHAGAVPLRTRDQIDHGGLGAVRGQVPDAVVVSLEAALGEGGVRPRILLARGDGDDPRLPAVRQDDLRLSHGPGPRHRAGRRAGCGRTPRRAAGPPPPAGHIRPGPSSARGACGSGTRAPAAGFRARAW